MDLNLFVISVGNTRTAVGAFVDGELTRVERAANDEVEAVASAVRQVWGVLKGRPAVAAAGVCVREALRDRVAGEVARVTDLAVRWVLPADATDRRGGIPLPVKVLTEHPGRTGVDRVLALAAAYEQFGKACCVVDAGTAITVNLCNDRGEFLGGAIAPGVAAQLKALRDAAPALPELSLVRPSGTVGRSTEDAIRHGVYHGIRGLVKEVVEGFATHIGTWPEVVATGGDAELLFGDWELIHAVSPDLLLYGIALAYTRASEGSP